jgi:hypothetical protein
MKYQIDTEFMKICKDIIAENKTIDEWLEIESDDMFQSPKYEGGFDSVENAFCFSIYIDSKEYWFQVNLEEVNQILFGSKKEFDLEETDM